MIDLELSNPGQMILVFYDGAIYAYGFHSNTVGSISSGGNRGFIVRLRVYLALCVYMQDVCNRDTTQALPNPQHRWLLFSTCPASTPSNDILMILLRLPDCQVR